MNFYLSMSPERLLLTLVIGYIFIMMVHFIVGKLSTWTKYTPSLYSKFVSIGIFTILILYSAFNVGERQANLKRSNFNSHTPEQIEKTEVTPLDSSKVLEEFQLKIKE